MLETVRSAAPHARILRKMSRDVLAGSESGAVSSCASHVRCGEALAADQHCGCPIWSGFDRYSISRG